MGKGPDQAVRKGREGSSQKVLRLSGCLYTARIRDAPSNAFLARTTPFPSMVDLHLLLPSPLDHLRLAGTMTRNKTDLDLALCRQKDITL